jgi:hypothetical protein
MSDQFDHDDDGHDHDGHGHPDMSKYQELFRERADQVENAARKVGLYLQDAGMTMAPVPTDTGFEMQAVMVANFQVGDQAWSDRVQNWESYTTDAEFRKLAVQATGEKFEEMKAEMERKLREGKGIFEDPDEDDDGPTAA